MNTPDVPSEKGHFYSDNSSRKNKYKKVNCTHLLTAKYVIDVNTGTSTLGPIGSLWLISLGFFQVHFANIRKKSKADCKGGGGLLEAI